MKKTQANPPASRHIGLGLEPKQITGLGQNPLEILQCGMNLLPQLEWTEVTYSLPLLDSEIDQSFGDTINLINPVPGGSCSIDTTFQNNSPDLQCDMLCMGYGVTLKAEPISFAQVGAAVPTSATAPIWSMDAFTQDDITNGAMGPAGLAIQPAVMSWGRNGQLAIWEMAQAYEFVVTMYQRQTWVKEKVSDCANFGSMSAAFAASDSDMEIQSFANKINKHYRNKGATLIFQPAYARRVGAVVTANPGPGAPPTSVAVSHVTSDFTLAAATLGGLGVQNPAVGNNQRRRLPKPVLFEAGIPVGAALNVVDECHYDSFKKYVDIAGGFGGVNDIVPFDTVLSGPSNAGTASTGLEQSADAVAVYRAQQVNTNRVLFQGGRISVGFQLYGWEFWGCWKEWACQNWQGCITVPGSSPRSPQTAMSGVPR